MSFSTAFFGLIGKVEKKYKLIVLLMYDGGLRRSEALNLKPENVNIAGNSILIMGKGEKERLVPITTDRLKQELKVVINEGNKYLSVNPKTSDAYGETAIRKGLNRAAKKTGLNIRIYPHLLRHSFGTHSTHAGIGLRALQDILGHSSSRTTEMYTHLAGDYIKAEGQKFSDYISQFKKK